MSYPRCRRCRHRFEPAEGYVTVNVSRGASALEQMENWRSYELCAECGVDFKTWCHIGYAEDPLAVAQIQQMDPEWDPS